MFPLCVLHRVLLMITAVESEIFFSHLLALLAGKKQEKEFKRSNMHIN